MNLTQINAQIHELEAAAQQLRIASMAFYIGVAEAAEGPQPLEALKILREQYIDDLDALDFIDAQINNHFLHTGDQRYQRKTKEMRRLLSTGEIEL